MLQVIGGLRGRHHAADAAREENLLRQHGGEGSNERRECDLEAGGAAGEEENGSRSRNNRERPDDVRRDISQVHPAEGARGPLLPVRHGKARHAEKRDDKRPEIIALDMAAECPEEQETERGGDSADRKHDTKRGTQEASETGPAGPGAVFGNEAEDGGAETQGHDNAKHDDPDPDIGEHAVLERAHPARQQHLAQQRYGRAHDADTHDESRTADNATKVSVFETRKKRPGHLSQRLREYGGNHQIDPQARAGNAADRAPKAARNRVNPFQSTGVCLMKRLASR